MMEEEMAAQASGGRKVTACVSMERLCEFLLQGNVPDTHILRAVVGTTEWPLANSRERKTASRRIETTLVALVHCAKSDHDERNIVQNPVHILCVDSIYRLVQADVAGVGLLVESSLAAARELRHEASARRELLSRILALSGETLLRELSAEDHDRAGALFQRVLLECVGDMWSAVRKVAAAKSLQFIPFLGLPRLEELVNALALRYTTASSDWRLREGIVLSITVIVRAFAWQTRPSADDTVVLQYGSDTLESLPEFVAQVVDSVLFIACQDEQRSIRDSAVRGLAAFLNRSSQEQLLALLQRTLAILRSNNATCSSNPHKADGLLSLLENLLLAGEVVHDPVLLLSVLDTLERYCGHAASTVRQQCSRVFFALVSRQRASAAVFFSEILQFLLTRMSEDGVECVRRWLTDDVKEPVSVAWESLEGRLLAIELLLGHALAQHAQATFLGVGRTGASPKQRSPTRLCVFAPPSPAALFSSPAKSPYIPSSVRSACASREAGEVNGPSGTLLFALQTIDENLAQAEESDSSALPCERNVWEKEKNTCGYTIRFFTSSAHRGNGTPETSRRSLRVRIPSSGASSSHAPASPGDFSADSSLFRQQSPSGVRSMIHPSAVLCKLTDLVLRCTIHERWEVRRMADQVLPLLVEFLCWMNPDILLQRWKQFLCTEQEHVRLSRAVAGMLRFAVRKALQLHRVPPSMTRGLVAASRVDDTWKRIASAASGVVVQAFSAFRSSCAKADSSSFSLRCTAVWVMEAVLSTGLWLDRDGDSLLDRRSVAECLRDTLEILSASCNSAERASREIQEVEAFLHAFRLESADFLSECLTDAPFEVLSVLISTVVESVLSVERHQPRLQLLRALEIAVQSHGRRLQHMHLIKLSTVCLKILEEKPDSSVQVAAVCLRILGEMGSRFLLPTDHLLQTVQVIAQRAMRHASCTAALSSCVGRRRTCSGRSEASELLQVPFAARQPHVPRTPTPDIERITVDECADSSSEADWSGWDEDESDWDDEDDDLIPIETLSSVARKVADVGNDDFVAALSAQEVQAFVWTKDQDEDSAFKTPSKHACPGATTARA